MRTSLTRSQDCEHLEDWKESSLTDAGVSLTERSDWKDEGHVLLGSIMSNAGDETVAFHGDRIASVENDDGFPVVDDLSDRGLAQYWIGDVIGRGSMGRVYRAEHLTLARPCAIKV